MTGESETNASSEEAVSPPAAASAVDPIIDSQLSFADSLLRGKSILMHGGTWTAEAREPNRRKQLHNQLRLSRKLRAALEHAADAAEKSSPQQARSLLIQHTPDISTLTCLTEAVKGRSILPSYDFYTQQVQRRDQVKNDEVVRAQAVLDEHFGGMTRARGHPASGSGSGAATSRKECSREWTVARAERPAARKPSRSPISSGSEDSGFVHYSSDDSTSTSGFVRPRKKGTHTMVSSGRTSKRRRQVETRRCHDCKSTTNCYRKCQYFFPDGTKCGKTFCRKCLEAKYEEDLVDDWETTKELVDWFCPSCLGTCICQLCTEKRRRENRAESPNAR